MVWDEIIFLGTCEGPGLRPGPWRRNCKHVFYSLSKVERTVGDKIAAICSSLCLHLVWEEQPGLSFVAGSSCRLMCRCLQETPSAVLHIAMYPEARTAGLFL